MPSLFNNPYTNLASKGRYGDTMLAHINPQEAALLKSMGGAGTINPKTGLREFFTLNQLPQVPLEPLPVLAQAFNPNTFQNIPDKLQTITVPQENRGKGGSTPAYEKIAPELAQYADKKYAGKGAITITGYTVPTDLTFKGKPLEAKYDPKGNFQYVTLAGGDVLIPDPNQPNIASSPRFNKSGGIVDYGVFDLSKQDNGSFGSFVGDLAREFSPMILAGLGANYLAGSGLLSSGAGAGGVVNPLSGFGTGAASAATTTAAQAAAAAEAANAAAGILGGGSTALTGGIADAVTGGITTAADAAAAAAAASGAGAAGGVVNPLTGGLSAAEQAAATAKAASAATTTTGGGLLNTAASTITPSILQSISDATGISVDTLKTFGPSVIQGLVSATGSVLTANKATDAAKTQADAQIKAAQIAADAARFRPVGVTTRFGTSNFKTDAAGNVIEAGYTPSAEITGYQDRLRTLANQGLSDVESARAAYSPLSSAAQNLFSLGQSYLAKTPEQAAQDYISKQTALLAPSRENQLAELRNRQFQTGREGVAVSQGGNLMNTSPEMAAYYNSLAQSNLSLAAQADQEARNRIQFGAGLFDTGANLQGRYYTGQTAAYSPFTTAIDTSSGLEKLAQQPLDLSTAIGQKVSTANANVGQLTGQGIINAAATMAPANAYSLGGNLLSGAANSPILASAVNKAFGNTQPTQQQYTFNPQTGQYVPVSQSVWI